MSNKILVVDDEERVIEIVEMYLKKEGFEIYTAADGEEAVEKVKALQPDLVVLDIMLPKMDGWDVCKEIRKNLSIPILMLTAKGEEFDRVLGLELGADDYLTKPFSPRELVARIKAILRRIPPEGKEEKIDVIKLSDLKIDYSSREVSLNGEQIVLTPKEFELLWYLASHKDKVFTREELLKQVWSYDYYGDLRTVDTHIKRLREKLLSQEKKPNFNVKTIWGVGYKFEVTD